MHLMRGNIFRVHRPKCSRTDVQGDERVRYLRQNLWCEMQTCRWRSDGAGLVGEYGLIALRVSKVALPTNVRRQRHRSVRVKIDVFIEPDDSLAVSQSFFNRQRDVVDLRRRANAHFAAWLSQTFPARGSKFLQKQELDRVIVGKCARRK